MRERDVAAWCAGWLRTRGFVVYGEVRPESYGSIFDLVGLRGDDVWIVETKTSFSAEVRHQAWRAQSWAHRVYVGVPWRDRPLPPRSRLSRFGVLYATPDEVFEARAAMPPLERPYVTVTRSACTAWHRDHPGGVPSTERSGAPTPYQARVWEIHRRLWAHPDGLPFPELERMVADLFPGFRAPRAALTSLLRRERAFAYPYGRLTRAVIRATGDDVPDDCRPGAPVRTIPTPQPEGDDDAWPEP